MTQAPDKIKFTHIAGIIIVCLFAFFVNNQVIPADLMESRNLATAQEMVREGNYLIPTMNGELRLAKPPLPTWIAAGIEILFPEQLVIQRYMAGISATLMVFFLFLLVSKLTRNRNLGFISALILASCFNIVLMGRTATWDIYCHSFMLGAIYFMVLGFDKAGKQWTNFLLSGVFMGLSFLSKGPVSFFALLLPFLIAYIIIFRPKVKEKIHPIILMIVICLIISSWWPTYIMLFHSDVAIAVANKESSSWLDRNVRPFYYYWQFPAEAGIWALFWVTSIIWFFWGKEKENRNVYKMSIVWTIAALVLLSLIPEKKTRYLLPVLIPGAINVAFYIYYSAKKVLTKPERVVFKINAILIAIILIGLPVALYMMFVKENLISIPIFIITSVISIALAIFILKSTLTSNPMVTKVFVGIILTMIMVEGLCMIPIGHMFINEDRHSIRTLRHNQEVKDMVFYYNSKEDLRMELVYESNKTIHPIDVNNDSLIYSKTPFVFVSKIPIDSVFLNKNVTIKYIDTFDNNWRKTTHKRHNKDLVRHVAIISNKF